MTSINQMKSEKSWFDLEFRDIDREHIQKPDDIKVDLIKDYPQSTIQDEIIDKIKGSIFGLAIGDALGAHVEFRPQTYLKDNPVKDLQGGGTWGLEKGQFTDDTSMALCLCNSLIACHDFVPYDQLVRYKWWYRYGYMSSTGHCFDIGAATRQSIQEFESRQRKYSEEHSIPMDQMDYLSNQGDHLEHFDVNCSHEGVAGNGALMRLAPVPLFFYRNPSKAIQYSGISGQITHGDKKAYDACRYYGALIVATINGEKKNDLLNENFYENHKEWFGIENIHPDILNIIKGSYKKQGGYDEGIRGKGYIINALEAALWAFWSDQDSFEKGVLNAINLGDDTDTTAAIYGQLAGAFYGYNHLPNKWSHLIYAKHFLLYVSHAIKYEGQIWFDHKNIQHSDNTNTINSIKINYLNNNSQTSPHLSIVNNTMEIIERKAINPSGSIGSLYDASIDSLEDSPRISIDSIKNQSELSTKCIVKRGDEIQSENLLEFVGFDDQLRLSLLSGIVSPRGIASMITYPYLIDEYTRLFYYSSITQQTSFIDRINNIQESINQSRVTHIITQIHSGIDIILIIRLTNDHTDLIDKIINNISQSLYQDNKLTDKYSLDQILSTHVYSNIPFLTEQKTIIDVYQSIISIKHKYDTHWPLNYIIHPIKQFYPNNQSIFRPIKYNISHKIEQHLLQLTIPNKIWLTIIDRNTFNILNKYLKQQLNQQQQQLNTFIKQYQNQNKLFQHFIINIRQGKYSEENQLKEILSDQISTTLRDNIDDFNYYLNNLKTKAQFISELNKRGFNYSNANEYNIQQDDDEITIQKKIIQDNKQRFICSNDYLNQNNWVTLNQLLTQIENEKLRNKDLNLIYLDFSYSTFELDQIKRFPSNTNIELNNPLISTNQESTYLSLQTLPKDKTINILLLGKSRVGKSTLINSFANYLKSKEKEESRSNGSIIEIIISFMSFIDNDSEKHFVRIGQYDSNEDYINPGQSITQKCKSYIFQLPNGQKLRFIDTPGFCDQHHQRQDQLSMQRILSRLNYLTHLNAICIVIDSNDKNINSLSIYLKELFNYLGDDIIQNILFCFTKTLQNNLNLLQRNSQLELMIKSLPINNYSINQENTFLFDSTYFIQSARQIYLTTFFNHQNEIIKNSLTITNNGWKRLLDHVQTNLQPYLIHQGLQKVEYLRLEIKQLIRPILETIRNIIRNQILSKTESSSFSIILKPKPIAHQFSICHSCEKTFYQCGQFWIISYSLHQYSEKCSTCSCHIDQHKPIDYLLEYIYSDNQSNKISNSLDKLIDGIVHFDHYLEDTTHMSNNQPFLSYLNSIIDEEKFIIQNKSSHYFNLKLYDQLVKLKHDYQDRISTMKQTDHHDDIIFIDKLIDSIQQIPSVRDQINVDNQIQETNLHFSES